MDVRTWSYRAESYVTMKTLRPRRWLLHTSIEPTLLWTLRTPKDGGPRELSISRVPHNGQRFVPVIYNIWLYEGPKQNRYTPQTLLKDAKRAPTRTLEPYPPGYTPSEKGLSVLDWTPIDTFRAFALDRCGCINSGYGKGLPVCLPSAHGRHMSWYHRLKAYPVGARTSHGERVGLSGVTVLDLSDRYELCGCDKVETQVVVPHDDVLASCMLTRPRCTVHLHLPN